MIYIAKVRTQRQQKQAWYIQEVGVAENSANTEAYKVEERWRAIVTRFDLAQGFHQAVEQVGKRSGKV